MLLFHVHALINGTKPLRCVLHINWWNVEASNTWNVANVVTIMRVPVPSREKRKREWSEGGYIHIVSVMWERKRTRATFEREDKYYKCSCCTYADDLIPLHNEAFSARVILATIDRAREVFALTGSRGRRTSSDGVTDDVSCCWCGWCAPAFAAAAASIRRVATSMLYVEDSKKKVLDSFDLRSAEAHFHASKN